MEFIWYAENYYDPYCYVNKFFCSTVVVPRDFFMNEVSRSIETNPAFRLVSICEVLAGSVGMLLSLMGENTLFSPS